jgi:predicted lipid-binding transport protein (Tim44 family)
MKFWTVLLAAALTMGAMGDADAARRLGGGGSIGRQSPNVTQRQATPPATTPAPTSAQQQRNATAQQPAAAQQPARSRFGGILGGLAAGLGLAWLASALGLGEAFGQILLFALLALVILAVFGMMRARRHAATAAAGGPGYAYQGAGTSADAPATMRQYNPAKVGNDASARPWESTFGAEAPAPAPTGGGLRIGSRLQGNALDGSQTWGVPPGFDTEGFLTAAKRNFTTLQSAWDRGDMNTLRSMMTDQMLAEIRTQVAERDREPQPTPQRTEVEMLEAQLLGIEELATEYMASVEFSGMMREEPSAGPAPFREVWNMVKPKDGTAGWLVAGVQALQ